MYNIFDQERSAQSEITPKPCDIGKEIQWQ